VVRAQCPTSARPGDAAIVLADGSIEGFIGGQCAEGSVRLAALPLIDTGTTLLLRILPEGDSEYPEVEGAMTVVNPCLSGGAVEVFLEPKLPASRLLVVGATPIAEALVFLGRGLGFGVDTPIDAEPDPHGCLAVLVSSHGRSEHSAIRSALDAGVDFIGLVASATRGSAVLDELQLSPEERAIVRTPVGLDIGAKTAEEIALSILADVVRAVRVDGLRAASTNPPVRPESVVDPVCGMTVIVDSDTPHLRLDDQDHWFCNPGCRSRFAEEQGVAG
jgi:xanthine dehydrogenase accessory factor